MTPPATISLRCCPVCGRTDRFSTLGTKQHDANGYRCPGIPRVYTYRLATA